MQELRKLERWLSVNTTPEFSVNATRTPLVLVQDMLEQVGDVANKSILSLNFDIAILIAKYHKPSSHTCIVETIEAKQMLDSVGINAILVEEDALATLESLNMQFDIVIGNPPFNESQEDRRTSDTHGRLSGGTVSLAKRFTDLMLSCCVQQCLVIQPYSNKVYSKKVQRLWKQAGLYSIRKASNWFNVGVEVGVYYFNKASRVEEVEDSFITETKPANNLGRFFVTAPGKLFRNQYESELLEEGATKVIVVPNTIKYTNDPTFNTRMQDRTVHQWRVAMPQNGSKQGMSSLVVAAPGDILSYSVNCFVVESEEQANQLVSYLSKPEVGSILARVKTSYTNAKKYFEYIETPSFLL